MMYGEAFRAPSLTELFNRSPVSVGNPNLEPEKIRTFELAWIQEIGNFSGAATLFRNEIEKIITAVPITRSQPGVTFINGTGETTIEGLELELQARIYERLTLRAGSSHVFEHFSQMVPKNTAFLICNYKAEALNVNLSAHYRSRTPMLEDTSEHLVANAKVQFRIMPQLSLALYGKNLSDEEVHSSVLSLPRVGVPERGREWLLSMTLVL